MRRSNFCFMPAVIVLAIAGAAPADPPPFTVTSAVRSGNIVPGSGQISSPSAFGPGQGRGVLKVAVNDSGQWIIDVHVVQTDPTLDQALLRSATGLSPFIAEGVPGSLLEPTIDHVANGFHSISLNNHNNAGLAMGLFEDDFSQSNPSSAAYLNGERVLAMEGGLVSAAGLAAGTTWEPFAADSVARLVDSGRVLIVSTVNEKGTVRRIVLVAQIDGSGNVISRTLVAKEGGPVGAGPDNWQTIAGGGHAVSMNDAGTVVFSGVTSGGTNGVYKSGTGFVAVQGGPSPVVDRNWGSLSGAPVDININGVVAIRGPLANGDGVYHELEIKDAGDGPDTADRTFGNGPLTMITGVLDDDHDVDMYRIIISDAANFSATTVPNPGEGFAGAAFDTVLTLIASQENGTRGIVQCDDVSASIPQSTITGAQAISGREYYLCVSTPKARPVARVSHFATNSFPDYDIWFGDPAGLTVSAGLVFWPMPAAGVVHARTTAGVPQADIAASLVSPHLAVDPGAGKLYWANRGGTGGPKILRSNFDGSNVEEIVTVQGFGTLTASGTTGMALDTVNGKLYWSRSVFGEINRCNLDGSAAERVIQDYPPTGAAVPTGAPLGNFAPSSLAIDAAGGKVYWVNAFLDRIERANLDGTARQTLPVGAGAVSIALHVPTGKIYWSNTAADKIQRSNLDGSAQEDVLLTPGPATISIDSAAARIYWTNNTSRVIRSALLTGTGDSVFVSVGPNVGQRIADGPGSGSAFRAWVRTGSPSGTELPYQVRITGATFRHENAVIAKGNQKVVATGDAIPGTSPHRMVTIGSAIAPIQISDRGDVLWTGTFSQPTSFNNYLFDGLFWNGERIMVSMDIVPGTNLDGQKLVNVYKTPYSISQSRNGEFAMVAVNMQDPPYNFTPQRDNALLIHFTLPAACPADYDGNGTRQVNDIFAFLADWFAGVPAAYQFGGTPGVPAIFAFLTQWFAGCP
ncbi:MAG: hypothetical protein KF869_05910 [Phycisphaeraceae bacterium]|nr:hypothetical protein [Phycisphaeraceae bacterium]